MSFSNKKIQKIKNLRAQGISVRKIAKRLKISTDSVIKYSSQKYTTIQPEKIVRMQAQQPKEPIKRVDDNRYSNTQYYDPYRVQPSTDMSNQYLNRPRIHSIETRQTESELKTFIKYIKSKKQIRQEKKNQEIKKKMQLLSENIDRLQKSMRKDREFKEKLNEKREQKLAFDQNKKTESNNLHKISTTNQDKENKIILQIEEPQKTENLEEQKKITDHKRTYTDKNHLIHDHNNDESTISDINTLLIAVKIFEGLAPTIGKFIRQEINKRKYNINPPKKVILTLPKKVKLREVKKKKKIVLTPANN